MLIDKVRSLSLSTRVMLSFVFLVALLAVGYSYALWRSVHFVETYLVSESMEQNFSSIAEDLALGRAPKLDPGEELYGYGGAAGLTPVPARYERVGLGYHEIGDKPAVYTYRGSIDGQDVLFVRDQQGFEEQEELIWLQTGGVGIILLVLSGLVGLFIARRLILDPVQRLASEVSRSAAAGTYRPISERFMTTDEIGTLARICDSSMRRLSDALEREKAFTADVSHELRTPLTVIGTSAELLEISHLNERQRKQVERILRAHEMMKNLVNLFLHFARADSKTILEGSEDTVQVLAARCKDLWQEPARGKGLDVRITHPGACPGTYSGLALGTVINNLLRNAVSYTKQGYVEIEETPRGVVVRDTGPGIEPAEREHVFEAFSRGRAAQKESSSGGVGLGLNIAQRICRRMGWSLALLDTAQGCAFELVLVDALPRTRLDMQDAGREAAAGGGAPGLALEAEPARAAQK